MKRIVVLGGGVGGTLTANLLARKLHRRIDAGEVEVVVIDAEGAHVYQPGFMYIAMGGEREAKLTKPERGLLDVHEEMGIMIQEVVGKRVGDYYFPALAGVAFTNNEYRWARRLKREDGLLRLAGPGLLGGQQFHGQGPQQPAFPAGQGPACGQLERPRRGLRGSAFHPFELLPMAG